VAQEELAREVGDWEEVAAEAVSEGEVSEEGATERVQKGIWGLGDVFRPELPRVDNDRRVELR